MLEMREEFYIVKTKTGIYQVRLVFNKECMATDVTLEGALSKLKLLAERYSTPEDLIQAWKSAEDLKKSNKITKAYNEKMYEEFKEAYKEEIDKLFEGEKPKLLKKRGNTLVKKPVIKTDVPEEKPVETTKKPVLLKPKKRIIFK